VNNRNTDARRRPPLEGRSRRPASSLADGARNISRHNNLQQPRQTANAGIAAPASLSGNSRTVKHVACGHPSLRTQRSAWMAERPNGLIRARSVIGKAGRSSSVRAQVGRIETALAASG
jgi:hypothetical protein